MEDVDNLDNIQDGFIHYQLIRFCQATRLQYLNGHVQLANQNVQQHVDHKIANALLNQGTRDAYKTWNQQDRAWVDMHLHESHDEGGFGVPNNTITRKPASYTTNASFVAFLCTLPALLQYYDCTDQPAAAKPAPPSGAGGSATANAGATPQSQPAGSQDNGHGKLVLPQLNRLHEAFKRSQVSPPASSSSQDQPTRPRPIPSQRRLTQQLTKEWPQYKALRQRYAGTRFEEQRQLHLPQKHKATVPESTLRVEMNGLEEQADNAKARDLYWKPLSWLGTIRPTSANDAFDPALWETFVSTTLGLEVPILAALPRLHNSPLAKCGCKKFCMDFHGDHTSTCTGHSGATKAHDWMVSVLGPLSVRPDTWSEHSTASRPAQANGVAMWR